MLPPMRPPVMPYFNGIPKRQTHTRLYALAFFHDLQLAGPVGPYSFASPPCGGFALDSIVISLYIAHHELQGFHTAARPKIYFKRQSRRSCIPLNPMITAHERQLGGTIQHRESCRAVYSAFTILQKMGSGFTLTPTFMIEPYYRAALSSGKRRIKRKNPEC